MVVMVELILLFHEKKSLVVVVFQRMNGRLAIARTNWINGICGVFDCTD
jgi:hypothetical protein